jgi:putative PIN family toxin of toxin-antitoxin system
MRRIVLDTNVVVSGFINPFGKPAQLLDMAYQQSALLHYDERILAEYRDVLLREKFAYLQPEANEILSALIRRGIVVNARRLDEEFTDQSDKKFFEVARHCDAILITGNTKHYPQDRRVMTDRKSVV